MKFRLRRTRTRGNILVLLLIGVIVFAALTAVVMQGGNGISNLTRERSQIAVDRTIGFASNLKAAVGGLIQSQNISETAIRFAHPKLNAAYGDITTTPKNQVFSLEGGGVDMVDVPQNVTTVAGQQWEFYANTAVPQVGDDATPDLVMVLPNITESFCRALNQKIGYAATAAIPTDGGTCIYEASATRFAGSFSGTVNTMDAATFTFKPAMSACVQCGTTYHFYQVLLER